MLNKLFDRLLSLWNVKKEFRLKVFLLSLTFLLMSASQAIWRPLKNSIFAQLVGAEYVPDAKIYSLLFLIPLIIFYSKLVDWLRRHQLLYWYTLFHGIGGIILYFLLIHPVYGMANTSPSASRITGWILYFFMESNAAFMSMSFWSFADSINNPQDAKNYYGLFVAGSKVGGMLTAGSLYLATTFLAVIPDHVLLPQFILFGSLLLIGAAGSIYLLMKYVPGYYMHGYEAAYKIEKTKEKEKEKEKESFIEKLKKPIEGLILMVKSPYVFGIFSLVLFYEVTIVIFDYMVLKTAVAAYLTAGALTAFYASYYFIMNFVGLLITIFGTTPLLRVFGITKSLFVFPIVSIFISIITILYPNPTSMFIALVGLRALNYALNHPTREILYIPTTKAIKFKAKAWTDAFGGRISKGAGSAINKLLQKLSPAAELFSGLFLSLGLIGGWLIVVFFLSKTLQNTITNKKVIGEVADK
ncbi:MAG: Npt1/Npt2 family nucleotide transporter [bacterium]